MAFWSNGSGKATTVRMLCGVLTPTGGEGNVLGYDIYSQTENIRQAIGICPKFSLYEELTVVENMDFYAGTYSVSAREAGAGRRIDCPGWSGGKKSGLPDHVRGRNSGLPLPVPCSTSLLCCFWMNLQPVWTLYHRNFWKILHQLAAQGLRYSLRLTMDEADQCHRLGFMHQEVDRSGAAIKLKNDLGVDTMEDVLLPSQRGRGSP